MQIRSHSGDVPPARADADADADSTLQVTVYRERSFANAIGADTSTCADSTPVSTPPASTDGCNNVALKLLALSPPPLTALVASSSLKDVQVVGCSLGFPANVLQCF